MALLKEVRGFTPRIGENCFLAENATIIGDVSIGNNSSVWFNAVIRGDVSAIRIGNNVNIQDGCVFHGLFERADVHLGNNITIGHHVIIHGATIEDNVLVGMGAIIMDHAIIKKGSIVAAGSLVLNNTVVEPNSLYGGVPARKIKMVDKDQSDDMISRIAENYKKYAQWYKL